MLISTLTLGSLQETNMGVEKLIREAKKSIDFVTKSKNLIYLCAKKF